MMYDHPLVPAILPPSRVLSLSLCGNLAPFVSHSTIQYRIQSAMSISRGRGRFVVLHQMPAFLPKLCPRRNQEFLKRGPVIRNQEQRVVIRRGSPRLSISSAPAFQEREGHL